MRRISCLLLFAFLWGCSDKDSVPSGVLPKDKMQAVLWDMIEVDQYSQLYLAKDSARINVKEETFKRYEQVFQLHGTSREQFTKSTRYYFSRPDIAKPLFDSLTAIGNRKRSEAYTLPHPAQKPEPPVSRPPGSVIPASKPGMAPAASRPPASRPGSTPIVPPSAHKPLLPGMPPRTTPGAGKPAGSGMPVTPGKPGLKPPPHRIPVLKNGGRPAVKVS